MDRKAAESRRILMVVPHRVRDLEGHALVAYHLQRKYGHDVEFSGVEHIEERLLESAPDAVVLENLRWAWRVDAARRAKELNVRVAVLPIVGLHATKEEFAREAGLLTGASALADCYLEWGEFGRRAVLEERLIPETKIHVSGCPRFDFYRFPYLALMGTKAQLLKDLPVALQDAPLVLWTTSTPFAHLLDEEHAVRVNRTDGGLVEEEVRALYDYDRSQFAEHSRLVAALASRHPDWSFLIKVHPHEAIRPYIDLAAPISNLHVAYDAPIRGFLYHCAVLIQRDCTTATEAWMLDKPVLQLEVGRRRALTPKEFQRGNRVVRSLDEADAALVEAVRDGSVPADQRQAREAYISEFYFRVDGKACERVAMRLHELVSPPAYTAADRLRTRGLLRSFVERQERIAASRWQNRLKDTLGIPRQTSLRFWKSRRRAQLMTASREISKEMVEELWKSYDRVLARPVPGTAPPEATGS